VACELFGWSNLDGGTLLRIRSRLAAFESMTFKEIFRNDSTGCHHIEAWKLTPAAKKKLAEIAPDQDILLSLRLTSAERIWGIRLKNVVDLLWWDPNHAVYESQRR